MTHLPRQARAWRSAAARQLLATAFVAAVAAPAFGQATERALYVSVLDRSGAPVDGLRPEDFVVREDGVRREVLRVAPATTAMQIAVLVDTSEAAADAVRDIREGLMRFVGATHEGNQISLITFGGPPRIVVEATGSLQQLQQGVQRLFPLSDQAAYLLDALIETTRGFERREAARPVIVVVTTTGLDFSHRGDWTKVVEGVRASGAVMHTVVLQVPQPAFVADPAPSSSEVRDQLLQRDMLLERGPRDTGGRRRDLLVSSGLPHVLGQLAQELMSQYRVVYARPDALIPPEDIQVTVTRADVSARGTPVRREGGQ